MRYIFSILIFLSLNSSAQGFITIQGEVTGTLSTNPLPYCAVKLKNGSIGVIANDQGKFELHFNRSLSSDTLLISYIGYALYEQPIRNILSDGIRLFKLLEKPYTLNEVVVGTEYTPKELIKNVIDKLAVNYSTEPFSIEGFLRMYTKDKEKYDELIEADISLSTKGYILNKKSWQYHNVTLNEVKSSLHSGAIKDMFIHPNVLNKIIEFHETLIKDIAEPKYKYEYSIDRTEYLGDEKIIYLKMYKKDLEKADEFTAYVKVNAGNWALEEIEYDRHITQHTEAQINKIASVDTLKSRVISDKLLVKYKSYKGKYYLNYFNWKINLNILSPTSAYDYSMTFEYGSNNIVPGTLKMNNPFILNRKDNLYKQFHLKPYHPEFWKNYNLLLDNPEMDKVHKDIGE
jgi:CarboxypepD_reg-like domain